jgi:hypothetical protein
MPTVDSSALAATLNASLDPFAPQVLGVADKQRAALKRKLSALQTSASEKLADAERKVAKLNQQASKLPSLGEWQAGLTVACWGVELMSTMMPRKVAWNQQMLFSGGLLAMQHANVQLECPDSPVWPVSHVGSCFSG